MDLLKTELFKRVLQEPADNGANKLRIVSGFTTPAMASRHLDELKKAKHTSVEIELICGMSIRTGIDLRTHEAFINIQNSHSENFKYFHSISKIPVHAKVYVWLKDDTPKICFMGSANYTQTGFSEKLQTEVMSETNPEDGLAFYQEIHKQSIKNKDTQSLKKAGMNIYEIEQKYKDPKSYTPAKKVELSLLESGGKKVQERSGLNWGQRSNRKNKNEAYIPIPIGIAKSDFFPERKSRFTVTADDGFTFIGVIAQDSDKAIESTEDNSIIGKYFRKRLGVASGAKVEKEDLENYGRTSVTFMKIDDENYIIDFSLPKNL